MNENRDRRSSLAVRMAANTIVQAVGSLLASVVGFLTFVAITRGLGPEAFGDFTAATVFLFVPVVLADVGLSTAVLREISADPSRTEPAMRASLPLRVIVSAIAVLVAIGVGLALPFNDRTQVAILLSSIGAFLQLMTLALLPVLQAQLKMHLSVGATLVGRVATLGFTLAALGAGYGFKAVVGAQVAGIAVTFLLHLLAVGLIVPLHPVIDTRYWRSLLAGAFLLGLAIALSQIYFRVDAVILSLLRSAAEVGFYGAAYKFIELSGIVNAAVGISMFPSLTRFIAIEDPRAARLVQTVFDLLIATAAPLAIVMIAFAEEIVVLAAGPEFEPGGEALRLLAPYVLFSFANGVLWRALISSSRDRALLASSVFVLVLNVVLNLVLIPEYGFKAAAVIAVASEAAVSIPLALTARQEGLMPNLRYVPQVVAGSAAMVLAILVLPGPWLLVAALAGAAYSAVLLLLPGTARRVVLGDLLPALRRS
jgi:O-antigen/teichoic acid export membrane protein